MVQLAIVVILVLEPLFSGYRFIRNEDSSCQTLKYNLDTVFLALIVSAIVCEAVRNSNEVLESTTGKSPVQHLLGLLPSSFLRVAILSGMPEIAAFIAKHGHSINTQGVDGTTPLFLAAQRGYEEVVLRLVSAGAMLNEPNNDGISPLYIAALKGNDEIVQILYEAGASVYSFMLDDKLPDGRSLLYIAAHRGDTELIKCLIDADVDVEVTTEDGSTALHAAARSGHDGIVVSLIEAGANVQKKTDAGVTPLTLAAAHGQAKCVKVLLQNGAEDSSEWRSRFNLSAVEARNQAKLPPFRRIKEPTFLW